MRAWCVSLVRAVVMIVVMSGLASAQRFNLTPNWLAVHDGSAIGPSGCFSSFNDWEVFPCSLDTVTANVVTTNTIQYTVTNYSPAGGIYYLMSCTVVAPVNSCSVNPPSAQIGGDGVSQPVTVTYLTSSSVGSGSVTLVVQNDTDFQDVQRGTVVVNVGQPFVPRHQLRVTVGAGAQYPAPGSLDSVAFTVTNLGNTTDSVNIKNLCYGYALVPNCFSKRDSVQGLMPDSSFSGFAYVYISDSVGQVGRLRTIAFERTHAGVTDTAYTDITVRSARSPGVVLVDPGTTVARQKCLTIQIRPGLAYECGDLRYTHALPAVRTYNKVRTPYLIYHSNAAHGHTALGALLTFDPTKGTPDTVTATVTDSATGATVGSGRWSGGSWVNGTTQRVTINVDESHYEGVVRWAFTLTATAKYNASNTTQSFSATGGRVNTNQWTGGISSISEMAGIEHIGVTALAKTPWITTPPLYWEDTEGDTREYYPVPGDSAVWAAVGLDRPDTIKLFNGPVKYGFYRYAEHGVVVHFEGHGQEIEVIDRLHHSTQVVVDGFTLSSVTVPSPAGGLTYTYVGLDSIIAPPVNGQPRNVKLTWGAVGDSLAIRDPDGTVEVLRFTGPGSEPPPNHLLVWYQDKKGVITRFQYDSAYNLVKAIVDSGPLETVAPALPTLNITWAFLPAESWGITTPVPPDSAYTYVAAPRANALALHGAVYQHSDSLDVTRYWVDQWGEPTRIRDAHGYETELARANPTYPSLVTYARFQNGRVMEEMYDARGNDSVTIDSGNVQTGAPATTHYTFDGKFDFVTQIVQPMGDQVNFLYDTTFGNMQWAQQGTGSSRRVYFTYYDSTAPGSNLVETMTLPVGNAQYAFAYDGTLGNTSTTTTPKGFETYTLTDGIGRIIRVRSPIDSLNVAGTDTSQHKWRTDSTGYDLMSRVVLEKSYGPADTSNFDSTYSDRSLYGQLIAAPEATIVTTVYDSTINLPLSRSRQAVPDINGLGALTNTFVYDSVGRMIQQTWPDGQSELYYYDAGSNRVMTTTRRAYNNTVVYDALNRRIQQIIAATRPYPMYAETLGGTLHKFPLYPNCGQNYCVPGDTLTFTYDPVGHLRSATNATADVRRTYFPNGDLETDSLYVMAYGTPRYYFHSYGLSYAYDGDDHILTLQHPSNVAPLNSSGQPQTLEKYAYDSLGRVNAVTDVLGNVFDYVYDLDGRIQQTGGPGTAETDQFDADSRLIARSDTTADINAQHGFPTTALNSDQYHYDAASHVLEADAIQEVSHNRYSGLGTMVRGVILPNQNQNILFNLDEEITVADAFGRQFERWGSTCAQNTCDSIANNRSTQYLSSSERPGLITLSTNLQQPPHFVQNFSYDSSGNRTLNGIDQSADVATGQYTIIGAADFYDAAEHLVVQDRQSCAFNAAPNVYACQTTGQATLPAIDETRFEEYFYDALGRRVLVRSRDDVEPCVVNATAGHPGCFGTIERTIYDGSDVLYEIRMPGDDSVPSVRLERDTGGVATYLSFDDNEIATFGRAVYTNGLSIDHPLDLIRVGYDTTWPGPVAVVPHVNWQGVYDLGSFVSPNPGAQYLCKTYANGPTDRSCFFLAWPARRYGYWGQDMGGVQYNDPWIGNVITGHRDLTNQFYLRNRYFDPQTQSFTQEDPIGLAGGLNAYGFAHGDPVNYTDPFGLLASELEGNFDCRKVRCPSVQAIIHDKNVIRAADELYKASAKDNRERGALLYRNADGSIRVGKVVVGDVGTVDVGSDDNAIGAIHTHPDQTNAQGQVIAPGSPPSGDDAGSARSLHENEVIVTKDKFYVIPWGDPSVYQTFDRPKP